MPLPCLMLRSISLHAYLFRSTCLGLLCHVSLVWFLSLLCVDVRLCTHMLYIMSMVMLHSDLCVRVLFAMFYTQIYIRTCLYAWIQVLPCLCAKFLHVYMYVSMHICLDQCFHMLVCLDLCFACFMLSSMCLCAPCHIYVPKPRLCLSCHVLLQPFCSFYHIFLCFGPLVRA